VFVRGEFELQVLKKLWKPWVKFSSQNEMKGSKFGLIAEKKKVLPKLIREL